MGRTYFATQLNTATIAIEVVWMICTSHGIDTRVRDGLHAERTLRTKQLVVVVLTVGLAIHFQEISSWKWTSTLRADKMLCVPRLLHCVHNGSYDHLSTSCESINLFVDETENKGTREREREEELCEDGRKHTCAWRAIESESLPIGSMCGRYDVR